MPSAAKRNRILHVARPPQHDERRMAREDTTTFCRGDRPSRYIEDIVSQGSASFYLTAFNEARRPQRSFH